MADPRIISCERHGDTRAAYICNHLLHGSDQGFYVSEEDPDNPYPDAWCAKCEEIRKAYGGEDGVWNEESEAHIEVKLVCGGCYQEIRLRNI
jgi:hypothetical protein